MWPGTGATRPNPALSRAPGHITTSGTEVRQSQGRHHRPPAATSRGSTAPTRTWPHHYGTAVLPARVRKPRDKAKAEVAVQVVERWILARLRHRRFHSLAELNGAIPRTGRGPQRQADAPPRHEPACPVRAPRARRPAAAAGRDLRLRRVAPLSGRARLPRRGARALLLRALPPGARGDRGAHHRPHGRAVPSRPAGGEPRPQPAPAPAHDGGGAHAERAPAPRRVDAHPVCCARPQAIGAAPPRRSSNTILTAKPHPEQGFRACLGILRRCAATAPSASRPLASAGLDIGAALTAPSPRSCATASTGPIAPNLCRTAPPVQHTNIRGGRYYH